MPILFGMLPFDASGDDNDLHDCTAACLNLGPSNGSSDGPTPSELLLLPQLEPQSNCVKPAHPAHHLQPFLQWRGYSQ
ncbi:hypothetical protein FRC11_002390, partial [Ceratobasidium sp. 423]